MYFKFVFNIYLYVLHTSMFEYITYFICKIFLQILAHLVSKMFFEIHGINFKC